MRDIADPLQNSQSADELGLKNATVTQRHRRPSLNRRRCSVWTMTLTRTSSSARTTTDEGGTGENSAAAPPVVVEAPAGSCWALHAHRHDTSRRGREADRLAPLRVAAPPSCRLDDAPRFLLAAWRRRPLCFWSKQSRAARRRRASPAATPPPQHEQCAAILVRPALPVKENRLPRIR